MSKSISLPPIQGSTTAPRETLSYRWVINNSRLFLQNKVTSGGLKSPEFSAFLPLQTRPKQPWHLLLQCAGSTHPSTTFYLTLCQGSVEREVKTDKKKMEDSHLVLTNILISGVTFSIVNCETTECIYSTTISDMVLSGFGGAPTSTDAVAMAIESNDMYDKYIVNDTLTVQVDATLFCFTEPIERLETLKEEVREVPVDDIREQLCGVYKDEIFTDVTIKCGEKEFKVHKVILASQSPVFRKMLEVDMKEKSTNLIEITDIDPPVLTDLLAYLYTGTAPNMSTLSRELLNATNKYEVSRLFKMCENELQSKTEVANVIEILLLAELESAPYLKKACLNYIRFNSTGVKKTAEWKAFRENKEYHPLVIEVLEFCGEVKNIEPVIV